MTDKTKCEQLIITEADFSLTIDEQKQKALSSVVTELTHILMPKGDAEGYQAAFIDTAMTVNGLIQGFEASGQTQTMLAVQMASIHTLQQRATKIAINNDHPDVVRLYSVLSAKLANTFIMQAQALQKLQGKGQQKVMVEHVNVQQGGQAIIGNVNTNAGGG